MDARLSMQSIYQNALAEAQRISAQLGTLQAQASTGQKFSQVSDDPQASLALLTANDQLDRFSAHLVGIQTATTSLNSSVSAMRQVNDIFTKAKSIALQASNSTNDPAALSSMADEVNGLIDDLLSAANTNDNGYIFGGTSTATPPYVVTSRDSQGNVAAVAYQGASDNAYASVDDNRQAETHLAGSTIFQPRNRQPAVFTGNTGAAPGSGTNSATGQTILSVTHTATTFAAGSGVQAGASSPGGDTIIGPAGAHNLKIVDTSGTGASGTVSLDGGPAIAFTNADTDLRVTSNNGDVIYVNTTAITTGFNGSVAITATGSMSTDGGASQTPITFTANQSVTNASTSEVTWVNTVNVARTGTTLIDNPGTADAFQALIELRDQLKNVNHLSSADQLKAISNQIADLDDVNSQVLVAVGRQSATLESLTSLQSHLQDLQLSTKKTVSDVGSADVADVVVKLQSYQQLLQMTLLSFSQINSTTLLPYLH